MQWDSVQTLNCGGRLLSLEYPIVMGILNVTPDSFFDGSKYRSIDAALRQAEKMLSEGASIIDVGGMSSRPDAELLDSQSEMERVLPVIEAISKEFPMAILSIDTFRADVAKASFEAGATIINDISGGNLDKNMFPLVAELGVPYILMHMKGTPQTMQQNTDYQDVALEILDFFIQKISQLRALNVKDVVVDVGFGFGKNLSQNYELLKKIHVFKLLEVPILAGLSRKSMICKVLETTSQNALNGTTALNMVALQQGAKILRVHDVLEAMQTIKLFNQLNL